MGYLCREQVLEQEGIPYEEVMTWTTDGFTEGS